VASPWSFKQNKTVSYTIPCDEYFNQKYHMHFVFPNNTENGSAKYPCTGVLQVEMYALDKVEGNLIKICHWPEMNA